MSDKTPPKGHIGPDHPDSLFPRSTLRAPRLKGASPLNASNPVILIVDDRPENLLVLERLLKETGAEVIRATSGNEALKAALYYDFALAILDVQMPEMDGYELAEYLRRDKKTQNLPIIFLTAVYSDELHVFKGYESGAVDFVTKPYQPEILLAKVRVFLQLYQQMKELESLLEVERTKSYLEAILLSMADAVMVISRDGLIRTVNEALTSLSGYERQEILGSSFLHLFDNPAPTPWILALQAHLASGDAARIALHNEEAYLVSKQGQVVPVLLSGSALHDDKNINYGVVLVARDIREQIRAQEALRRSEEKYRLLYESSMDGIALCDMDGNFLHANRAFLNMLGYEPRELMSLNRQDVTPEKWRPIEQAIMQTETLVRGYSDEYEKEYFRKDGSLFPAAVRVWLFANESGKSGGMWSLVRDMTGHKLSEQNRVMTEKMTALGMMAGGIAHELNNPLMGIHGFVEYCLKHTDAADKRHPVLEDARRETKRCMDLVENLLTFSNQRQATEEEYRMTPCEDIFDRTVRLLAYRIEKDQVKVVKRICNTGHSIRARENSMQQVFLNLMVNALDALKDSEKREIAFEVLADRGCDKIKFTDTGCGISTEHMKKIFDPFFTTKPVGKGTGLGLSVSASIVKNHGGKIRCESEVGKGTKFTIELPKSEG